MKIKIKLPWTDRVPSRRKLQQQEMWQLIDIMLINEPTSEEYIQAFDSYERLHKLEMEESRISAFKWSKVVEIGTSVGLTAMILTHEMWTPLPGVAKSMALNQFKNHNNNNLLGM